MIKQMTFNYATKAWTSFTEVQKHFCNQILIEEERLRCLRASQTQHFDLHEWPKALEWVENRT